MRFFIFILILMFFSSNLTAAYVASMYAQMYSSFYHQTSVAHRKRVASGAAAAPGVAAMHVVPEKEAIPAATAALVKAYDYIDEEDAGDFAAEFYKKYLQKKMKVLTILSFRDDIDKAYVASGLNCAAYILDTLKCDLASIPKMVTLPFGFVIRVEDVIPFVFCKAIARGDQKMAQAVLDLQLLAPKYFVYVDETKKSTLAYAADLRCTDPKCFWTKLYEWLKGLYSNKCGKNDE